MKRRRRLAFVLGLVAVATPWAPSRPAPARPQSGHDGAQQTIATVSFRILFGIGDKEPAAWDGRIKVSGGSISSMVGWRFAGNDSTDGRSSWKASTARGLPPIAAPRPNPQGPMLDNGVVVTARLDRPQATFSVETKQGNFSFTADETPFGEPRSFLNGRARVDRVPTTHQLTSSVEEQDYPAAAETQEEIYLAYVEFKHGRRLEIPEPLREEPRSFDFLVRPAGGDQVLLMRYSKSRRNWSVPREVSAPGQDIMHVTVAVDGQKRVWVFWSANKNGNFDLYSRAFTAGRWSSEMRVTTDPGTDVNPVAVTDAKGRVWVAWQGLRRGNLEILAAAQDGNSFTRETIVSPSPASDWDPAIAASASGDVAVSWDTYDKGDYDVYFRRLRWDRGLRMDAPVPVARSQNFEARTSIAYDPQGRLWVAYEIGGAQWGKDFGSYETTGVPLDLDRNLQVKCFRGSEPFTTASSLAAVLPAASSVPWPDPALAKNRKPGFYPQPPLLPRHSLPRLAVDSQGTVYLAFRTVGTDRSAVGTVWNENVTYFDGTKWRGPVVVPGTDGLLDSRPALLAPLAGQLLLIAASDHRQSPSGDGVNSDLYIAEMNVEGNPQAARLVALPVEKAAPPTPEVKAELEQVALLRNYRGRVGEENLRLMRGDFHRHTEMSFDGGRDGPLIDAYRYAIDTASLDWLGCCDHDNGGGREYSWWTQQKLGDAYRLGAQFIPMFSYERAGHDYPEGHRNVLFARRGIRPLPRLPAVLPAASPVPAPDTQMLYRYLRHFGGIAATHTTATGWGTDWRDNDPALEPVVEIYQGLRQNYEMPGAPRANSAEDSIGGWRPLGFVSLALQKGYRLGFVVSSDHVSTHMSYANVWVTAPTREGILEALRKRRVYGSTDNILADVRCGGHFMGEEFSVSDPPAIAVKLRGTAPFARVHIIKDGHEAYSAQPGTKNVDFVWKDAAAEKGKTSYYYVRGEQADGELVWVSPMWITYR